MSNINFTISNANPSSPPVYDPRLGLGLSIHINSENDLVWIGLSSSPSRWGRFETYYVETASDSSPVGDFILAPPVITTSNAAPTTPPQYVPTDGRIHFHISYLPSNLYRMYLGYTRDEESGSWVVYDITEII